jgi:hypothetical protein
MNLGKAEVKILTLQGVGKELETQVSEAIARHHEMKGGHAALVNAIEKMQSVFKAADDDCDNGKFSDFGDALVVKKLVKEYLLKAAGSLENLAAQANAAVLESKGRVDGLRRSLEITKKQWAAERQRVETYQRAVESGEVSLDEEAPAVGDQSPKGKVVPIHRGPAENRPDGVRPHDDIAQRRQEAREAREAQSNIASTTKKKVVKKTAPKKVVKKTAKKAREKDAANT